MTSPLADSKSPFLRHGAEQPVAWLPWGAEAFERARSLDRPILLDIGAVWCHWCHVMDRESYEDPETAALINERYVPVKVDRDERPDVDARYQRAVQTLTGQGGWPLTAFLTPAGELFHGGTYFPPEDAYGRPSFRRVLTEVARVWAEERERADEAATAVRHRLDAVLTAEAAPGEPDEALAEAAVEALGRGYDARHGGFGPAPKFPNPGGLQLLLDRILVRPADRLRAMLEHTLRAMADGGLYDQLGGGFHRYATDDRWLIPHFEKMAYDNGPLLEVYARAAESLDAPRFREVAEGIVAHYRDVAPALVERGGFPASQDADIGFDDDGDYWTWTEAELRAALEGAGLEEAANAEDAADAAGSADAADAAVLHWGLGDPGSAMHQDPDRHVLFRAVEPDEVARRLDRPADQLRDRLDQAAAALKAARDRRPAPYLDTTLYTGWVALVASGHLAAARHLQLDDAGHAAVRALERVWLRAWRDDVGLAHRVPDPDPDPEYHPEYHPESPLHLADQAHAAQAFVDAFEWTQDPRWLTRARALAAVITGRFGHPSGALQDRPVDADPDAPVDVLRQRRVEITDSPEPSPTAVAAMTLARIGALLGDDEASGAARRIVAAYAGSAPRFAPAAATYFRALRWVARPVTTVVVVEAGEAGEAGEGDRRGPLLRTALRVYRPETVVRRLEPGADTAGLPEALRAMVTGDAPRAYVCAGQRCAAPVSDPADLARLLQDFHG